MTDVTDSPALGDGCDATFEAERPRLIGIAYRMLGTFADAEDVVQDAWVRWQAEDRAGIERPAAWLTTVTTRLALDRLRSIRRRREDYVGPWLPEPIVGPAGSESVDTAGPESAAELADSLTLGFLTLLDRLAPVERAVFLLSDVFGFPFRDVAVAVDKSDAACRQIASRARRRLQGAAPRRPHPTERQVVDELLVALAMGDVQGVLDRLAPDVVLVSDGGSTRHAARRPVVGAARVARFLSTVTRRAVAPGMTVTPATVNGDPGAVIRIDDAVELVTAFELHDGRVGAIWIVVNPEKLEHVGDTVPIW